ncbi:DUF1778 domain-containing protein [Streptosporangium sp. NBC_01755]|uniref:type II toxin-antitoxin system TacA family antitoxin n=1 Tax=unclassified Streptosporangium TaxID=2632669 RepID=UPI002DD9FABC|nr:MULTISPECIES: DUF1778 domain-containing protein [unclassified Streptosporangium]WSA27315.1 DUF1778 domain-containing protein [Streptosporangium sp. NBC_01810]WSD01133.1 DUF1778 domain-containing protein [Streptosporangium sp. NBC_01755]
MTRPAPGSTASPRHDTRSRLEVRISTEDKNLIEQAARARRETVTGFVLHAALDAAEEVMRNERITVVPPDFFEAIIDSLDAPPQRNEALARAARESREIPKRK